MIKKKIVLILACILTMSIAVGCSKNAGSDVQVTTTISHDTKHNSALTKLSVSEFEDAGFELGDSCDVIFENGYELSDVPYYDGFYVKEGEPIIVINQKDSSIVITLDNVGIWETANLTEGDSVEIKLNTEGKYSAVQEVLGLTYSSERDDYDSDEVFCNFRAMSGGNLKNNFFYRGASPVNNVYGRAAYTDKLISEKKIKYEVDLADSEEEMNAFQNDKDNASPYAASLYENRQVVMLDLDSNFRADYYREKVADGMREMMKAAGPVYIHCTEGKDRTGFVCILLESLAGASYDEMLDDFMESYKNYYSVDVKETPEKYKAIAELYFDDYICCLLQSDEVGETENVSYVDNAAQYLRSGGMTECEIEQLKEFLKEE